MTSIQVISDVHLEIRRSQRTLYEHDIPVNAPHLALLGDIGLTVDDALFDWLTAQLRRFKIVFFVAGNHEPYKSSLAASTARLKKFAETVESDSKLGTFIHLDRTRFDLSPTVTVLGCTLWSALEPENVFHISMALNDFHQISSFEPEIYDKLHLADRAWLNSTVAAMAAEEPERKVIVFTHHAPTMEGVADPKFFGGINSSAFSTELTADPCWTSGNVKLWAFGHTHWCCDFIKAGVRVLANQRGYYPNETDNGEEEYDPGLVVDVETQ
ncbi:Ser/Thr protein phosphatase protein [Mycena floridula]|nr:Ser/Thr protein phosphatase protein [Mycena floridula]KAJ7601251.1 Ser/Thr protein phosphatase protein [Mycena floridula]